MHRISLAVALSAALLGSPAGRAGVLDPLWSLVSWLFPASQAKSEHGCGMDPDGQCSTQSVTTSEEGCGMDPSGQCSTTEHGCGMDPNG
jgi:hypothetical protein